MKNEYLVAKLLYNQGVWLLLYQSCLTKCETQYYSTSILSLNHYLQLITFQLGSINQIDTEKFLILL